MTELENKTQPNQRIIGFDILRAIMLFMLFVFHSGVSFMETTIDPEIWTYKNEATHIIFDGILGFIHTFRHPTFFIISGFVTEMMYRRYAHNVVLKRRIKRLFIPFLITAICLGPIIYSLLAQLYGQTNIFSVAVMFPATEDYPYSFGTSFIWFLYYLVIYNVLHYAYHRFLKPKDVDANRSSTPLRFYLTTLILIICVAIVLVYWNENSLFGVYSFLPAFGSVGGYFLFYIMGILLYRRSRDMERLKKYAWPFTLLGFVAVSVYFIWGSLKLESGEGTFEFDWGLMIPSTFAAVFFSFGGLGLAMKYYKKPNKTVSFISKSSYFLYLIHFPFVLILLHLVADKPWGALIKFSVVLGLTTIIALIINYIWIKAWKNKPPI